MKSRGLITHGCCVVFGLFSAGKQKHCTRTVRPRRLLSTDGRPSLRGCAGNRYDDISIKNCFFFHATATHARDIGTSGVSVLMSWCRNHRDTNKIPLVRSPNTLVLIALYVQNNKNKQNLYSARDLKKIQGADTWSD